MASETRPTVLDLWVCPDCGAVRRVTGGWVQECDHGDSYAAAFALMQPVRALVLDDAAVEAGARALVARGAMAFPFEDLSEAWRDAYLSDARAVLGMEESDDD